MYLQLRGLRPLQVDLILYPRVDLFRNPECATAAEMDLLWKPPFLNHDVKGRTTDWNVTKHFFQLDQLLQR
jgi:hypothetical protein